MGSGGPEEWVLGQRCPPTVIQVASVEFKHWSYFVRKLRFLVSLKIISIMKKYADESKRGTFYTTTGLGRSKYQCHGRVSPKRRKNVLDEKR